MLNDYDARRGIQYARSYANYFNVPEEQRLFFYDRNGSDCTNFCSQCVWAAYGGWLPGLDKNTVAYNRERIKMTARMTPYIWYGSPYSSGSNKWCRVVELYDYAVSGKSFGPNAFKIFEGTFESLNPGIKRGRRYTDGCRILHALPLWSLPIRY
jgi:hypothetical protein